MWRVWGRAYWDGHACYSEQIAVLEQGPSPNTKFFQSRWSITEEQRKYGIFRHVDQSTPLEAATKFPLTEQTFRDQFGPLGGTAFELRRVAGLENGSSAMAPKSVLNELRRAAVEKLVALREKSSSREVGDPDALEFFRNRIVQQYGGGVGSAKPQAARLHVLVRTLDQLRAALAWSQGELRPSAVYCDFEDIRKYKEAVPLARAVGVPIGLATVRIIKPGEDGLLRQVAACEPDFVLVRNLAGLCFYQANFPGLPLVGDYSLNVSNELTAALFLEQGVRRLTPSYDLSWGQMSAMFGRIGPSHFEAVVHQHMPMFHMEHCVFCHTLSSGTSHKDCGRPCDEHRVDLRDRVGVANPLIADVGCRNTVYNGLAQSGIEYIPKMRRMGIVDFRVELLRETAEDVAPLLSRYAGVMTGEAPPHVALRSLRVLHQLGVTRGTLE